MLLSRTNMIEMSPDSSTYLPGIKPYSSSEFWIRRKKNEKIGVYHTRMLICGPFAVREERSWQSWFVALFFLNGTFRTKTQKRPIAGTYTWWSSCLGETGNCGQRQQPTYYTTTLATCTRTEDTVRYTLPGICYLVYRILVLVLLLV